MQEDPKIASAETSFHSANLLMTVVKISAEKFRLDLVFTRGQGIFAGILNMEDQVLLSLPCQIQLVLKNDGTQQHKAALDDQRNSLIHRGLFLCLFASRKWRFYRRSITALAMTFLQEGCSLAG